MSALLVLAILAGVLAVPAQKVEGKISPESLSEVSTKKDWKDACKEVNKQYKKFIKNKKFHTNFTNKIDYGYKARRLFDKKVAKKYKISPQYSFCYGITSKYYEMDSKKEIKKMHKELRYLSKLCAKLKNEHKQYVNQHGDYYRLMKYSSSEIKAETLGASLRKRISYKRTEKLSAARNKELDKKGDFEMIYKKKMNYDVFLLSFGFNPHASWIDTEQDIIKAIGYKAGWGSLFDKTIDAYSVMLVKDGSNHNKKYWKSVWTYNVGKSCQYEKGGYVGEKRYRRLGVSSKMYWGGILGECYPGQFSVEDGSEDWAVTTVKSGTVIEIPKSYYVPEEYNDHIFTAGNGVACSETSDKICLQFSLENLSENSAEVEIDLMDKALHVTVIP